MKLIKQYIAFVWAVLVAWRGWVAGTAIGALIGLSQHLGHWETPHKVYWASLGLGILYSFFTAWQKEYVANRDGPDISMEWDSGQPWNVDRVRLRNIGASSAFNVSLGPFSHPWLTWHRTVEQQSIHPTDLEKDLDAQFKNSNGGERGHLGHILESSKENEFDSLTLDIVFFDRNNTKFTRTFSLQPGGGPTLGPRVKVVRGNLKVERP